MSFRGKVEFTEDEPTESQKKLFRQSVENSPRTPAYSGNGRGLSVKSADTGQVVDEIK